MTTPVPDTSGTYGLNDELETATKYDYNTGLPLTDPNGTQTTMDYDDPLLRPTKVTAANGHQTITEYGDPDSSGQLPASERFVKVKSQIDASRWKEGYTWFDGIGRTIRTQSVDDAGDVFTLTCYDIMGRVSKATNPFRGYDGSQTCSTTTGLDWTGTAYDDLGRVLSVTTPDTAHVDTAYSLAISGSQIGTVVTVTDQAGKLRRSITNALGQLIRVDEPVGSGSNPLGNINSPNQATLYGYDLLNNLTSVNQGAQTRTFVYDTLSRLIQATNPESGTIKYTYDANGNLKTKWDARGIKTIYDYDSLNRVWKRCYKSVGTSSLGATTCATATGETAEPNTPDVTMYYDNVTNAKGKLIKVSSSVSTTEYTSFDILGRVTGHKQTTDGNDYTTAYSYNLAGALIEETYPSGRKVKNTLDSNGDLSMVQSGKCLDATPGTHSTCTNRAGYWSYANSFTYNAAGAVTSMQLGNGRWESTVFNSRLQPTQIALGTVQNGTDKLKLDYGYGTTQNNGNVLSQTITVPTVGTNNGFVAVQNYSYDELNRLSQAYERPDEWTETNCSSDPGKCWMQTFSFDRYGNRNFIEASTTTIPRTCGTSSNLTGCADDRKRFNPSINVANNRLSTSDGYSFDSSGNTTGDSDNRTFIYDGENKQVEVKDASNNIIGQYFYNGDGQRVKKIVPSTGEVTIFVYAAAEKLVAEYSTIVASPQDAKVGYLTSDHLGSPRINTDQNGNVTARHDYLPYGEEVVRGHAEYNEDKIRRKFTIYARESEIDLDYARLRMYANKLGRFLSADPIVPDMYSPLSQNRYQYCLGNPLRFIDVGGGYDEEVHRDLTVAMAILVGFSQRQANIIGKSNQDVDIYQNPEAKGLKGYRDRILYHFTTPEIRNSHWEIFGSYVDRGDENSAYFALGTFLHAEQDSFSHSPFTAFLGQAPGLFDNFWSHVMDPDDLAQIFSKMDEEARKYDLTTNDPAKAVAMARDTIAKLLLARNQMAASGRFGSFGRPVPYTQYIDDKLWEWAKTNGREQKAAVLGEIINYVLHFNGKPAEGGGKGKRKKVKTTVTVIGEE